MLPAFVFGSLTPCFQYVTTHLIITLLTLTSDNYLQLEGRTRQNTDYYGMQWHTTDCFSVSVQNSGQILAQILQLTVDCSWIG